MQAFIECPSCKGRLTGGMKHALGRGECPFCGAAIKFVDALGVLEFIDAGAKLDMPLMVSQVHQLIEDYFKKTLSMKDLPNIVVEDDMPSRVRRSGGAKLEEPEIPEDPKADSDTSKPKSKLSFRRVDGNAGVVAGKTSTAIKLTPQELADIKAGVGIMPIATPGGIKTSDGDGIKFVSKEDIFAGRTVKAPVDYAALDAKAAAEAAETVSSFQKNPGGHVVGSADRPVQLPKLSAPGSPNSIITTPEAVLTPRDILGENK